MSSDFDAVKRIIEAFERSDWKEIDVRSGNLRVHLASTADVEDIGAASIERESADVSIEPVIETATEAVIEPAAESAVPIPPGAHVVTSPSPGVFWRAPEPGAPPFTEIGMAVEPTTTLCILEVMKLMNHLNAGVDGEVVAIYVEDGVAVAKDEPLFAVARTTAEGPTS